MTQNPKCPKCGGESWLSTTIVDIGEGVSIGGPAFRCENFECRQTFRTPEQEDTTRKDGDSLLGLLRSGNFDL